LPPFHHKYCKCRASFETYGHPAIKINLRPNRTILIADSQELHAWNCLAEKLGLTITENSSYHIKSLREERLNMNQEKDDFVMLKTIDPQPVQSPETSC
jgi:hypothetical protein